MSRFFLLGLMVVAHLAPAQEFFRLTGKITNPQQDYLTFTLYSNWVLEPQQYHVPFNSAHEYLIEFPLQQIAYCDISFGEHGLHLLKIEPNDRIHLHFNQDNFVGSVRAEGAGAAKWNLQLLLWRNYEIEQDVERNLGDLQSKNHKVFVAKIDSLIGDQLHLLAQHKNYVTPEFFSLQKADIVGKLKLKELAYLNAHQQDDQHLSLHWDDFSEEVRGRSIFMGQIAEGLMQQSLRNFRHRESRTMEYEHVKGLKKRIGQKLTESLLASRILAYLHIDGLTEELKLLGEDYLFFSDNDDYKKGIAREFKKKEQLDLGKSAPDFIVENTKGKMIALRDFKGKNVILGFYNEDCFLCFEDIKAMEFVEGYFAKKKDLAFVFVHLGPREAFKSYVKHDKPMGIHLNGHNNPFLQKGYSIDLLPSYLILDKSGKILSNSISDPRLDDGRSLIQDIERLIYNK